MGTMAFARIIRVVIRSRSVKPIVAVTNQIIAMGNNAAFAEAATKGRVMIINLSISVSACRYASSHRFTYGYLRQYQ
jgi:hypothetical protein